MKHIKLYEAYISEKYITYDKMGNWGTPSEIEDDLRTQVINIFLYGGISDHLDDVQYADQSTDKGIKWQIEIKGKGTDTIHTYKDGKFRGQYEWYLNKKKSSKYDIQQYFLNKYVSELDRYLTLMQSFDLHYQMSDDRRAYKRGQEQGTELQLMYTKLSKSDQKKAHAAYIKKFKTDVTFDTFKGY